MNKIVILIMAVLLWGGAAAPGFALLRRDFTAVEGPVLKKDDALKQLIVHNSSTGKDETFVADDAQMASVKVGDTVLILHQIDTNTIGNMVVTQPKS